MDMETKKRKSNRLSEYDYSQIGAYYITLCTNDRKQILSRITVGASIARPCEVHLSRIGEIVKQGIIGIEEHYDTVTVDNYVIMPNHVHLIIQIHSENGRPMVAPTVARIIQQFKGYVTKQVGQPIWQKLYYDHVIRDDYDYMIKYQYIDENPSKWEEDELNR